ncbi:GPI anchored cell wall protein [Aspergillus bombycis]|uniref:GPI anchored cell wall protein n=1 Tax=Aspergillus bombycis TaxID=109264 RepID=A0A1F7ZZ44_9EURO|nr:GPI anchored cell wall protein [Aspergillus bombycis]OGM44348.1 GPI anchored cell wall protein [Aspergillus bombycis]
MLFAKSALVLSFLALGNIAAAAVPRACLLDALSNEPSPGDLKAVCVDKVQTKIESLCSDDDKQDALKQFADTCSSAGHKVVVNTSTSSSASSTGTSTADSKSSSSGFVTATATSTSGSGSSSSAGVIPTSGSDSDSNSGSGSGSGTNPSSTSSSGVPLHTANAGSSDRHIPAAAFAAVVFVASPLRYSKEINLVTILCSLI